MKFNKITKRFAVAALAGVLAVSTMGISAAATDAPTTKITSLGVTKVITTDGVTYAPNTTFKFTVANGASGSNVTIGNGTYTVLEGITGGLTAGDGIAFSPTADGLNSAGYTKTDASELSINAAIFLDAGIYHYVVTEQSGSYEGIVYDTNTSYDVYLFVYYDADHNPYVGATYVVKGGVKQDSITFTNNYGNEDDKDNPNDSTHDVTISKVITGSMADMTDEFTFTVTVNGGDGEMYKVEYKKDSSTNATTSSISSSTTGTDYTLGNGGSITISGLTENDLVTVVEKEANENGYTTTVEKTNVSETGSVSKDAATYVVTNSRDTTTPTGIALTIAPYVLMVALAAVVAVVFLRKRSYEA